MSCAQHALLQCAGSVYIITCAVRSAVRTSRQYNWMLDVCSVAGDSRLQVGQKLHFSMPLPHSHEELMSLLTPTKEMVTDVVKDRIRSERAKGKQEITLAEPVQAPPQLNTALQTAK